MSIEIPEGFLPAPWHYVEVQGGYEIKDGTGDKTWTIGEIYKPYTQTRDLVILAPQMAAEIKRLEAEKSSIEDTLSKVYEAYRNEGERLRARIALLEAALQLPEGCDVFQLERAMKEGAVDDLGKPWVFVGDSSGDSVYFKSEKGDLLSFYRNGKASLCAVRLWCKKGGNVS